MIWRIGLGLSSAGRVGVRTEQELQGLNRSCLIARAPLPTTLMTVL